MSSTVLGACHNWEQSFVVDVDIRVIKSLALPIDSIIHARKVFLSFVRSTKLTPYHTLTMGNYIRYNKIQVSYIIVNFFRESFVLNEDHHLFPSQTIAVEIRATSRNPKTVGSHLFTGYIEILVEKADVYCFSKNKYAQTTRAPIDIAEKSTLSILNSEGWWYLGNSG